MSVIVIYSFGRASFKTVSYGYVLAAVFVFTELYLLKKNKGQLYIRAYRNEINEKAQLLGLGVLSFLILLWFSRMILSTGNDFGFFILDRDAAYYSNLSMMLGETGEENRTGINNLFVDTGGIQPYHYLDLWLGDFGALLSGSTHIVSLYLFVYPILTFISLLGILAFIEKLRKITFLNQLFALLLLFMGGVYLNYHDPDYFFDVNLAGAPMEYEWVKYTAIYPFVILSFLFFAESTLPALATLFFLPVVSISFAPGIITGSICFGILQVILRKIEWKELLRLLVYSVILILFFKIVYGTSAKQNPYLQNGVLVYTDIHSWNFTSFKIFLVELFYRIKGCPLRLAVLHLPFLICFIWMYYTGNIKQWFKDLAWLVLLVIGTSMIFYGTFYKMIDAQQFYSNELTLLNVLCVLICILWFHDLVRIRKPLKLFFSGIILLSLFFKMYVATVNVNSFHNGGNIYSESYLNKLKEIPYGKDKKLLGVMFGGATEEEKFYILDKSGVNLLHQPFLPGFYPGIDLNVFDIKDYCVVPEISSIQKANVEVSPFYRFVMQQKQTNDFVSVAQSRLDFINKYHITYLVISRYVSIDSLLQKRIVSELIDEKSGERFVKLKN
ncbi:MAG: hypothetical protein ACXVDU_08975 [Bacteroidia bacterium]